MHINVCIDNTEKPNMEEFKTIITIASPFIASYLTYLYAIKGKQKESDQLKRDELNTVLSHLLVVWNYLTRIELTCRLKFDDDIKLPIPKEYLPIVLLKSGILSDNSFEELESSIKNLKKHDPISFYELEGIGRKLDYLKKTFIVPFVKGKSNSEFNKTLSDKYLKIAIEEIEDFINSISKSIGKAVRIKSSEKLKRNIENDIENIKTEIMQQYYDLFIVLSPDKNITFDQFSSEIEKPEIQDLMERQFEMIKSIDIENVMESIANNPNISIEQVAMDFLPETLIDKKLLFNVPNYISGRISFDR